MDLVVAELREQLVARELAWESQELAGPRPVGGPVVGQEPGVAAASEHAAVEIEHAAGVAAAAGVELAANAVGSAAVG